MTDSEHFSEVQRIQAVYATRDEKDRNEYRSSGFRLMVEERDNAFEDRLSMHLRQPIQDCSILDVGCGDGGQLAWFRDIGADPRHLHGIDLLPIQISRAQKHYPQFDFTYGNAEKLPFPSESFDLVIVMTAFSSILDRNMARNVADEILRVLRPDGLILWYDMRYPNPWNPHVRAMSSGRIQSLFPTCSLHLKSITVIPQVARALDHLDPRTRALTYRVLSALPFMRSHLVGVIASSKHEAVFRPGDS